MAAAYTLLIAFCWLLFVAYWLVSAVGVKKTFQRSWWQGAYLRLAVIAAVLVLLHMPVVASLFAHVRLTTANPVSSSIGVFLCAAGIAFAIWARRHLGRNWGMPMAIKEEAEFVTSGPYAYVRHPIYAGMLIAMLGSVLVEGVMWLVPLVVFGVYFIYSAQSEERHMAQQFPEQYPAYAKHTKMFIPFIF